MIYIIKILVAIALSFIAYNMYSITGSLIVGLLTFFFLLPFAVGISYILEEYNNKEE